MTVAPSACAEVSHAPRSDGTAGVGLGERVYCTGQSIRIEPACVSSSMPIQGARRPASQYSLPVPLAPPCRWHASNRFPRRPSVAPHALPVLRVGGHLGIRPEDHPVNLLALRVLLPALESRAAARAGRPHAFPAVLSRLGSPHATPALRFSLGSPSHRHSRIRIRCRLHASRGAVDERLRATRGGRC
jgi:hypothetical protein